MPLVMVFDFDGVILESVPVKDQAIFDLFEDATIEERRRVLELHRNTPGICRSERIALLLTEALGREAPVAVVNCLLARFAKLVWKGLMVCPEVPGIRYFLNLVADIPCYVVSASPQEELREVAQARDFSHYFIDIFGMPTAKENMLRNIMAQENVSSESILFIGDKISDYRSAIDVGTQFIGRQCPQIATKFPDEVMVINDFEADQQRIWEHLIACRA